MQYIGMLKSMQKIGSSKNINQRSDIKFIHTVASPKIKSSHHIHTDNKVPSLPNFNQSFILITLAYQNKPIQTYRFPYNQTTTVSMLLAFIKYKIKRDNVYLQTHNLHLDYFLTLPNRLVSEISISNLKITARDIVIKGSNMKVIEYDQFHLSNSQISLSSIQIIKCIGCGGFSKVFLGRLYGMMLAIKVVDKNFIISTNKEPIIENQRLILELCENHPFITKLYAAFQTKNFVVFAMEYCNGGELFNLLRKVKRMSEKDARFYFIETLSAIEYLHSRGVLYRDLKPENIMLDYEGHVKLADFGLSKIINNQLTYSFCGSAQYMSPEMLLKKGHGFEVDYYCLGALLYQLVTGLPPYYTTDQSQLFENILTSQIKFPQKFSLSDQIKDFFVKILQKDPKKRFQTIKQIISHPWIAKNCHFQDIQHKSMIPPYPTQFFSYNFDDSEFVHQEKEIMLKVEKQATISQFNPIFPNIYYESKEIIQVRRKVKDANSRKGNFMKIKSSPKIDILHESREQTNRSRQSSINSMKIKQSYANQHYFPSNRQSNNIWSLEHTKNIQSTPILNRFLKNNQSPSHTRKQSINSSVSRKNSLDKDTSANKYPKNIYTSKMGYYQNKYSSKLNNNSYDRLLKNHIYRSQHINRQDPSRYYLPGTHTNANKSISQSYQSLSQSNKPYNKKFENSYSKNKSNYSIEKLNGYNQGSNESSYSKKLKASQLNGAKRYLDVHKGKMNGSKLKKSGMSNSDKNFFHPYTLHNSRK